MNALIPGSYAMSMNSDKRHLDEIAAPASPTLGSAAQQDTAAERGEEILRRYRKAFSGLSADEMAVLDGIILETRKPRC
jgi:hypothetical protein